MKLRKYTTKEYIDGIKNDDQKVIKTLYHSYREPAFYFYKKIHSRWCSDIFDDLYQECFMLFINRVKDDAFELKSNLKTFFLGFIKNHTLHIAKSSKESISIEDCITEIDTERFTTTDKLYSNSFSYDIIKKELSKLSPIKQKLIEEIYFNDKTLSEIHKENSDYVYTTLKTKKCQALNDLKKVLKEKYNKEFLYENI